MSDYPLRNNVMFALIGPLVVAGVTATLVAGPPFEIARMFQWLALIALLMALEKFDRLAWRYPINALVVSEPVQAVAARRLAEGAVASGGLGSNIATIYRLVRWRPIPVPHLLLHAQSAKLACATCQVILPLEVAAARGCRYSQLH